MKQVWLELPERSNLFWLNTIKWIALRVGRWLSRLLLYPITAYFVIFSHRTRAASCNYLRRVLGHDSALTHKPIAQKINLSSL